MTAEKVFPKLRDRASKERHCETVSTDHNGRYLAYWIKDLREAEGMVVYHCFLAINQTENHNMHAAGERTRKPSSELAASYQPPTTPSGSRQPFAASLSNGCFDPLDA